MNRQQRIERLEKELAELKRESDFKVGDWIVHTNKSYGVQRITHIDYSKTFPIRISDTYENDGENGYVLGGIERKATEDEIRETLSREAKKKGFKKGVTVKRPETWRTNSADVIPDNNFTLIENDYLSMGGVCIYYKGVWATIEKSKQKFFDWNVEHETDYLKLYCDGHQHAGEIISHDFIINTKKLLLYVSDKTVAEVLDELKKL